MESFDPKVLPDVHFDGTVEMAYQKGLVPALVAEGVPFGVDAIMLDHLLKALASAFPEDTTIPVGVGVTSPDACVAAIPYSLGWFTQVVGAFETHYELVRFLIEASAMTARQAACDVGIDLDKMDFIGQIINDLTDADHEWVTGFSAWVDYFSHMVVASGDNTPNLFVGFIPIEQIRDLSGFTIRTAETQLLMGGES